MVVVVVVVGVIAQRGAGGGGGQAQITFECTKVEGSREELAANEGGSFPKRGRHQSKRQRNGGGALSYHSKESKQKRKVDIVVGAYLYLDEKQSTKIFRTFVLLHPFGFFFFYRC